MNGSGLEEVDGSILRSPSRDRVVAFGQKLPKGKDGFAGLFFLKPLFGFKLHRSAGRQRLSSKPFPLALPHCAARANRKHLRGRPNAQVIVAPRRGRR